MSSNSARRALVTGVASGIGEAIAARLEGEGWSVLGIDRVATSGGAATRENFAVDLARPDQINALPERVFQVDAFIHAAGIMRGAEIGGMTDAALAEGELMWRIHVDAATRLANRVLPFMRSAKQGRIVLIGSRVANGKAGRGQYAASKAAVIALARSWAAETVSAGITVNVVSPAATQTAMLTDPSREQTSPQTPPIGRFINVIEIAASVSFLLSSEAAAITGQNFNICGGASLF